MTTDYVVFSYKSDRFARSLASGYSPQETCFKFTDFYLITHSLILELRSFWSLLINTTSLSYNTSKGAEIGHVMLHLDTTRIDISQSFDIATIITCTVLSKQLAQKRADA